MRRSGLSLFAVCGTPLSRISRARLQFRRDRPHAVAFDEPGVRCGWQDCEIPAEGTCLLAVQLDGNVGSVERADDVLVLAHVVAHFAYRVGATKVADHRNYSVPRMQILDEPECLLAREKAPAVPSRIPHRHQLTIWPPHRRNAARAPEVDVHAGTVEGAERVIDRLEIGPGKRKSVERQEALP